MSASHRPKIEINTASLKEGGKWFSRAASEHLFIDLDQPNRGSKGKFGRSAATLPGGRLRFFSLRALILMLIGYSIFADSNTIGRSADAALKVKSSSLLSESALTSLVKLLAYPAQDFSPIFADSGSLE